MKRTLDLSRGSHFLKIIVLSALIQLSCGVSLAAYTSGEIYSGTDGAKVTVDEVVKKVTPGSVVFFGELHNQPKIKEAQLKILQLLKKKYKALNVGMEFFAYNDQKHVNSYRNGTLAESDFLSAVKWGSYDFSNYRDQVLLPSKFEAKTLALNAPRSLTSKIAQTGLESLSDSELGMMPPDFTLGNDDYYIRFRSLMEDHVTDPTDLKNYFIAQSTWDDTMAWQIVEFFKNKPDRILFVIVGEFHVQYGGGLPDRVKARSDEAGVAVKQLSISSVALNGLNDEEQEVEVLPSPDFGQRADYIWTFQF